MEAPTPRPVYTPSGRFDSTPLAVSAVTVLGLGLIIAAALAGLTHINGYAVGWIWIPVTALLCFSIRWAVGESKCRHRGLAFALGLLVGFIVFVGMYHIDQCSRWGVHWASLDRLPGYIAFRMETDGWWARDGRFPLWWPQPAQAGIDPWLARPTAWNWHWTALLGEIAFMVIAPAVAGWIRASRPFSELLNDWCARDIVILTPNSATALQQALADGTLAAWVESGVEKTRVSESHLKITGWYYPRPSLKSAAEAEVYLTIGSDHPILLEPEEAAALAGVLPGLQALAAPESAKYESALAPPESMISSTLGHLIQIPGPHIGRAKETWVRWKGRLIAYSIDFFPLLGLFGICGVLVLVAWAVDEGLLPQGANDVCAYAVALPGALAILIYTLRSDRAGFKALIRYYRRVITEQATQRPDPLFALADSRAIYGEVAPRRAWSDMSGRRQECEGGVLLLESERSVILFEGDRYRYIVPLQSIVRCEVEEITQVGTTDGLYAVVLVFRIASGTHELPIVPLDGIDGGIPWEKAAKFHEMIQQALAEEALLPEKGVSTDDPPVESA